LCADVILRARPLLPPASTRRLRQRAAPLGKKAVGTSHAFARRRHQPVRHRVLGSVVRDERRFDDHDDNFRDVPERWVSGHDHGIGVDPSTIGIVKQCKLTRVSPPSDPNVAAVRKKPPDNCAAALALSRAVTTTNTGSFPAGRRCGVMAATRGPPCGASGDLVATRPSQYGPEHCR
jgi:hypothetical protein